MSCSRSLFTESTGHLCDCTDDFAFAVLTLLGVQSHYENEPRHIFSSVVGSTKRASLHYSIEYGSRANCK